MIKQADCRPLRRKESPGSKEQPHSLTRRSQRRDLLGTESAAERETTLEFSGEKVKRWSKSPPVNWRQFAHGKPCGLKDHVNQGLRAARPILEGRSMERFSNNSRREMTV